ncbi:SGNH/GDSL hydrolase family protein [Pyxidicoccus fallax]|uniref:SGNH/GDSL hydrolase family protein n=1 Tax=Pyxidicoccus fallax TaxID=394095 RepID=A0A848L9J6_9BACT|nr:SGNH/GDSL hydrolase family protein [Pyxidicoccus fallax]NPC78524.1 SGNH/GDSL hydrolase family protein [Pyxidicoccus fallax]
MNAFRVQILCGVAAWLLAGASLAQLPTKQANVGDSMSQGAGADGWPGDHPELSWVRGTSSNVYSVFMRYQELVPSFTQQPESVSGAEMVGGGNNFAAQAARVCAQEEKPQTVSVLLGSNDVCNRPRSSSADATANMYSLDTWVNALRAGLDQLAACLPPGATVHVLSFPRVDFLYSAGYAKGLWCPYVVWPGAGICRIVTAERSGARRAQIGARVNEYNEATRAEVELYRANADGRNPRGIHFVADWQGSIENGYANTSVGTYVFRAADINGTDCFHPSVSAQRKLACVAWASNPHGAGTASECLQ